MLKEKDTEKFCVVIRERSPISTTTCPEWQKSKGLFKSLYILPVVCMSYGGITFYIQALLQTKIPAVSSAILDIKI